jgi:acyl carrier protein
MARKQTFNQLKFIIKDVCGIPAGVEFTEETTFQDLWFDSLDIVNLVCEVEDEWDIEISNSEWFECQKVGDIIELVEGKLK